ncbi:hypothetical protein BH10PSE12_BH10PSE12_22760 [soil metagenome]
MAASRKSVSGKFDISSLSNAPRQRRSHDLTLRVLDAAETVMRQGGLEAVTIAAVAREAKVSVGGLYGRFENRDELISAIHYQAMHRLAEESAEWLSEPADSYETALTNLVARLIEYFEAHGSLLPVKTSAKALPGTPGVEMEGMLRTRLAEKLSGFAPRLAGVDLSEAATMIIHILLASAVREATTDPRAIGRTMTWDKLRRELPAVVIGYLQTAEARAFATKT